MALIPFGHDVFTSRKEVKPLQNMAKQNDLLNLVVQKIALPTECDFFLCYMQPTFSQYTVQFG